MLTLEPTDDGSLTSYSAENGERYHNRNGAWEETEAIYIKPSRFKDRLALQDILHIMDPFFGLGYISLGCIFEFYDALKSLTSSYCPKKLIITAVENDTAILAHFATICDQFDHILAPLIKKQIAEDLFLSEKLLAHKIYYQTHDPAEGKISPLCTEIDLLPFHIDASIEFRFYLADTRKVLPQLQATFIQQPDKTLPVDCVYHDPFSPTKMPELWTREIFAHYKQLLRQPTGIVFTYSQSSAIRGGMQEAGLVLKRPIVEKYPKSGTCGVLETIVNKYAGLIKDIHELSVKELCLLQSRAGISYVDNLELNLMRDEIVCIREEALRNTERMGSSAAIRLAASQTL